MLKTVNKIVVALLFSIMIIGVVTIAPAHAEEINTNTVNTIENVIDNNTITEDEKEDLVQTNPSDSVTDHIQDLPNSKLNGFVEKVEGKTLELIVAMQKILSGACVVVFLIGAGKILLGIMSSRGGSWIPGAMTMLFSGIAYVCITYAADIIAWFNLWVTTP